MSIWSPDWTTPSLSGDDGELVSVRVSVSPRQLEDLLEALAEIPFPINPQLHHHVAAERGATVVEFPAYAAHLDEVRDTLRRNGFDPADLRVTSMLDEITRMASSTGQR